MAEKYSIFEEGTLPSFGKIYPGHKVSPDFKIRSMTTEEEMRRLSHSDRPFKVICDIIDECLIDKPFDLSVYDMCLGDYQYLLHKLRSATYGSSYKMEVRCPICGSSVIKTVDLDAIPALPYDESILEAMEFTLPKTGKRIVLRVQTPRMLDSLEVRKKEFLRKSPNAPDPTLLFSLSAMIESVDGEHPDGVKLENFLRKLPMADTNTIMKKSNRLVRDIGLNLDITCDCEVCGGEFHSPFRITPDFYGPSLEE